MKRLFLPLTLLLSCAVAQSADLDKTDLTVNNRRKNLKDQNPPDDEMAQVTTSLAAVSLRTGQRPNLTALFHSCPAIIHLFVAKYENLKKIERMETEDKNKYDKKLAKRNCDDFAAFKIEYENEILKNIKTLHTMGASPDSYLYGKTALEIAVEKGSPRIIKTLITEIGADVIPLFRSDIFKQSKIKSLSKCNAVIEAISELSPEKQKAIGEKAEQIRKEQITKEEAELKKQQEEDDEQKRKYNEERTQQLNRIMELEQKLLNPVNQRPPTYY
jgi:hypothetical protein